MANEALLDQLSMDPQQLYREETFTDRRIGTIRRLTPVDAEGNRDPARPVLFSGQTQVMTPVGPLPLSFGLQAETLEKAAADFPRAAQGALEETMEELKNLQREQAGSIVVPGQDRGMGSIGAPGVPFGALKR